MSSETDENIQNIACMVDLWGSYLKELCELSNNTKRIADTLERIAGKEE